MMLNDNLEVDKNGDGNDSDGDNDNDPHWEEVRGKETTCLIHQHNGTM